MLLNCIIDGNYLLSKLVFTLHKNNILYGSLHKALEVNVDNYRKFYPFKNIYLVSDSKEKSWRKNLTKKYKSNRKKDSDIDWNFVYQAYSEFKESLTGIKVLESPHIEGDDWISFLCHESNLNGISSLIISNDYDIKQIIKYSLDPLVINIMTNEMYNKEKIFLPKNYSVFLNKINSIANNDIFNLNDNNIFIKLLQGFIKKYEIHEIDSNESLLIKLISGDKSDNIESAWCQIKNGKKRGIGEKGAKVIYDRYIEEFGEIDINDIDLYENIADIICEKKKISKTNIEKIVSNIENNSKLIDLRLSNLPNDIVSKMSEKYKSL
jgi:5'-3' exonuclease